MIIAKGIILLSIFLACSILGVMFANRYKDRVEDLKQMRGAFNMLKTKIEYTYEPLPTIFSEIADKFTGRSSGIFLRFQKIK